MCEAIVAVVPASERLTPTNPWPGLAPFAESDRLFFRGRERESDELARLVRREALTVLFGRSGLGKTSLLGAGLFPRLREDLYLPVQIRLAHGAHLSLREQVWQAIDTACRQAGAEGTMPLFDATLWEHFHRADAGYWNARNRGLVPVLVFDQFEEIFTHGAVDDPTRTLTTDFVAELADLIEDRQPDALRHALEADPALSERIDFRRRGCKVVLSFREDFLAEMEGLRGRIPSLMRNRYRLLPMDGLQARDVVASGGSLVEADAADRIIGLAWRNRAEAPTPEEFERMEVDPALLSVICSELNLRRIAQGNPRIGTDLLAGAEREILVDFYTRSLDDLDARVRIFVEDELITEGGFRDSHALENALKLPGVTSEAVDRLVARRLLRVDDRFGVRRLELTHDVLTRVVQDSRDARQAREAEAAAAERERQALAAQQRNRRQAAWIGVAAVLALGLVIGAGISIRKAMVATQTLEDARKDSEQAKVDAEAATQAAVQAREAADAAIARSERVAAESRQRAENDSEMLRQSALAASRQQAQADEAKDRAERLNREALATNLIVNARSAQASSTGQPDLALLLGAEASRGYPDRLDAQLAQLSRLISADGLRKLVRVDGAVSKAAISPDGRRGAVGTDRGDIVVVDLSTWNIVRRWKAHNGRVSDLAFDADGSRLVSTDGGQAMLVWQVASGKRIGQILRDAKAGAPQRVLVSPRGRFMAIAVQGGAIELWPMPGQGEAAPMRASGAPGERDAVVCMSFDGDESTLLYGVAGGVKAMRLPDGDEVPVPRTVQAVLARSADCRFDAELGQDAQGKPIVQLRDAIGGTIAGSLGAGNADTPVKFSRGGRFVAVRHGDTTTVWGTEPLREVGRVRHEDDPRQLHAMEIDADGRWLARSLEKGDVTVQSTADGAMRVRTRLPQAVDAFAFSPSGDAVAGVSYGQERAHPIWRLAAPSVLRSEDGEHKADEIEFNRAGTFLATVEPNRPAGHLWAVGSARHLRTDADRMAAEFSPDGSRQAILRAVGGIDVLDTRDGRVLLRLPKPATGEIGRFAISKDNLRIALAQTDGTIHIHEIRAASREKVIPGQRKVEAIAFSPDGRALAIGDADGVVRLYRFDARVQGAPFPDPHNGRVLEVVFSPDGTRLATGGEDNKAILRDVANGQTVASFHHEWDVDRLVFIEGGEALVSGKAKGGRDVWDVRQGRRLARLRDPDGAVTSVDISPTGRRVALLHADDTVTLRSWDTETMFKDACDMAGRNLTCSEWRQFMPDQSYRKTCPAYPAPVPACR
ncbi:nSTAND1 domain-containing NTPase [Variovorax sp. GT1P44]|uniref:nSTAND1 domain-containing NTPase n=1 Tax=Variovorax sp. GT1P44 TaxID=3443742 RepID=UPI003F451C16